MKSIIARNLDFSYSNVKILSGISFEVNEGDFVSFIGPSGCGKTTLLNLISGLNGDIKEISKSFEESSRIFQTEYLFYWKTVIENVLLPCSFENGYNYKNKDEFIKKAKSVLELVGLDGYENYYPHELSGGMKKRVELARALMEDRELLILDEPFSSLDIITRENLNVLIKNISKNTNKTVILVTHSVEEACYLSDKIYILSGKPATITGNYQPDRAETVYSNFKLTKCEDDVLNNIRDDVFGEWVGNENQKDQLIRTKKTVFNINNIFSSLSFMVLFILICSGLKYIFNISDLIYPYPADIFNSFIRTIADLSIFPHIMETVAASMSGFIISLFLVLILSYIITINKKIYNLFMPLLISLNTIPIIALVPFLIIWFGFGMAPKIVISALIVFFPMLINFIEAFKSTFERYREFIHYYKIPIFKKIFTIDIIESLPRIFIGIKISITLSVIGAVVGEFDSGERGLGVIVRSAKTNFDTSLMFVGLVWLIIIGLSYYYTANLLSLLFTKYHKK